MNPQKSKINKHKRQDAQKNKTLLLQGYSTLEPLKEFVCPAGPAESFKRLR